jgi:tyrosyl-tRNA synthetase
LHLNREYGCDVQIGGSDQWGNIVSGVDLIRRKDNKVAYGLTIPLIVDKATGKKFGKSEGNAVWIDPDKTSPFQFYQFWLNSSDESVEDYLKLFTLLPMEEITPILLEHDRERGARVAQKRLAHEVTSLIHGEVEAAKAENISEVLFGNGNLAELDADEVKKIAPTCSVSIGTSVVDALVSSGLATSKREARQFIEDKAVNLKGLQISDVSSVITEQDFVNGIALLKRGKRNVSVLVKT